MAVRIAVLGGTGRWGRNITRTVGELKETALAWSIGSREDWKAKLTADRPDAVAIATPAGLHAAMALAAIELDLPVFIEKPMATTVADAEAIRDLAARRDVPVVVDHVHLFNPVWRELKRRRAELGDLRTAESEAGNAGPFRSDISPLWDWGPHDVALAIDLAGSPPVEITDEPDADGNYRFRLSFSHGLVWRARVGSRFVSKARKVTLRGSQGEAVWDDLAPVPLLIDGRRIPSAGDPPLAAALKEFADAASRRSAVRCSGVDLGVEVVRVLAGL